jgi:transposase
VAALIPAHAVRPQGGGRQRVDDRAVFTAIVFVVMTGCPWRHVLSEFGVSAPTVHRRFQEWTRAGVWRRMQSVLAGADGAPAAGRAAPPAVSATPTAGPAGTSSAAVRTPAGLPAVSAATRHRDWGLAFADAAAQRAEGSTPRWRTRPERTGVGERRQGEPGVRDDRGGRVDGRMPGRQQPPWAPGARPMGHRPVVPSRGPLPPGAQRYPGQQYPGQQYPGQQYPGQPYPGQVRGGTQRPGFIQGRPVYPGRPVPGRPVPGYPGQPRVGHPTYPGQPYPGQHPGRPYPSQLRQPYPPTARPGQPRTPGQQPYTAAQLQALRAQAQRSGGTAAPRGQNGSTPSHWPAAQRAAAAQRTAAAARAAAAQRAAAAARTTEPAPPARPDRTPPPATSAQPARPPAQPDHPAGAGPATTGTSDD